MQIPWLTRPPTAEEVAAHAKAYPIATGSRVPTGRWLFVRDDAVAYFVLLMPGYRTELLREYQQGARWLPCTADGIPVCFQDFGLSLPFNDIPGGIFFALLQRAPDRSMLAHCLRAIADDLDRFPESSAQAGSCDAAGTAHSWEITIRGAG